jgi:hypothetical protein
MKKRKIIITLFVFALLFAFNSINDCYAQSNLQFIKFPLPGSTESPLLIPINSIYFIKGNSKTGIVIAYHSTSASREADELVYDFGFDDIRNKAYEKLMGLITDSRSNILDLTSFFNEYSEVRIDVNRTNIVMKQ